MNLRIAFTASALLVLAACGGGGGGGSSPAPTPTPPTPTYSVGFTVSGLVGSGLVLRNNGGDNLTVATNGSANFATSLTSGSAYAVTVFTQPSSPSQTCVVANEAGNIASANVSGIAVVCTTNSYTVGVSVSGLAGSGLVLRNNGGDNLAIAANGGATFATSLASGVAYAVTVFAQPSSPTQTCNVTSGTGNIASANVSGIAVACTTNAYAVGGTVTGLSPSNTVVLQNNGADDRTLTANGTFAFATSISSGTNYSVAVATQPSSPPQRCAITNGSGTVTSAAITNVGIACVTLAPRFGYSLNSGDGTLTSYVIDAATGQLRLRGGYAKAGTTPIASALDPSGKFVYVANNGSANVSAFAYNATTGVLTEAAGSPFTAGTQPSALTFHPNGSFVYVTNAGSANVSAYAINATTGVLTAVGNPVAAGTNPTSIVIDSLGKFAYVLNNGSTNIYTYSINQTSGALTEVASSRVSTGANPLLLTLHANGKFIYADNQDAATISGFAINANTGVLTSITNSPFTSGAQPQAVRIHPNGKFAYVRNAGGASLSAYAINATTGALTAVSNNPYTVGTSPSSDSFDATGRFLYVANFGTGSGAGTIHVFDVNATTGIPTAITNSPFSTGPGPKALAIDPSNKYLYAVGTLRHWIYAHSIDTTTGALTRLGSAGTVATGVSPLSLALYPATVAPTFKSKFAYTANSNATSVSGFTVGTNGALTAITGSSFTAGTNPRGVAIDTQNRFVFATNEFSDNVSSFAINSTTGVLTQPTGSPVAIGTTSAAPYFLSVDPTSRFVYVANRGTAAQSIGTFAINQTTGVLTAIAGAPSGLINPRGVVVEPTGRFAYATNNANAGASEAFGRVSGYAINKSTGALTALTGSPYANLPASGNSIGSIAADPSGRFVYTTNSANASVSVFTINAGTGELSNPTSVAAGSQPRGVALTPNGKFAYVVNGTSSDIFGYTVDSITGGLAPFAGNPIAAGLSTPWSIVVDYSGNFAYVANSSGTTVAMYSIDQTTGALTAISGTATTESNPSSVVVTTDIQ